MEMKPKILIFGFIDNLKERLNRIKRRIIYELGLLLFVIALIAVIVALFLLIWYLNQITPRWPRWPGWIP